MSEIRFEYDDSEVQELVKKFPGVVALGWKYVAEEFWGNIKREAPTDHGRLAGSFVLEQYNELSYHIKSGVEYAMAVYSGTGTRGDINLGASGKLIPIEIFPVRKKALYWPGADHPVKHVSMLHPGMRSNPYVDRAAETTRGRIDEFISRAMREMGVAA